MNIIEKATAPTRTHPELEVQTDTAEKENPEKGGSPNSVESDTVVRREEEKKQKNTGSACKGVSCGWEGHGPEFDVHSSKRGLLLAVAMLRLLGVCVR